MDRAAGWWRPAADVEETAEAYLVELELPGVKQEDISVELSGGELVVSDEVKERERVGFLRSKTRRVGRFDYRLSLPADIEEDQDERIIVERSAHRASAQGCEIPASENRDHQLSRFLASHRPVEVPSGAFHRPLRVSRCPRP
jgi:hypothetical protein